MWLPELLLLAASASAQPPVVVTFDNGGFNAPLYAPRWSGFARPSAASEIAASVARVAGENPEVWTYLPPGRAEGRPGDASRVMPRLQDCDGAADKAGDPCWCGPGDRCWGELAVNRHPSGSTSLYLTAARLREGASGARVEVHFTDLFEEDPSTAEDPADSDRCVTRAGVHKALEGLLAVEGSVDHLAIGLLRVAIDGPPPGSDTGSLFAFSEGTDGCWAGDRTGPWAHGAGPLDFGMAVVVVGIDTADAAAEVDALLEGLQVQLSSDSSSLELVSLREPPVRADAAATLDVDDLAGWRPPEVDRSPRVACDAATVSAELTLDGQPVPGAAGVADCSGGLSLTIPPAELRRAWIRAHGLNPLAGGGRLEGTVRVTGTTGAPLGALGALTARNDEISGRPMPLFDVVDELARGSNGVTPYTREAALAIQVAGLDTRPWLLSALTGLMFFLAGGLAVNRFLLRTQANRAYQAAWDRAVDADDDPLRQRPVAAVIAEAQEEVRRRWLGRWLTAGSAALLLGTLIAWVILSIHLVKVG